MPILNNGGKCNQDKEKRAISHQADEVKPLQLKIPFFI
jgi:hypothetical protein